MKKIPFLAVLVIAVLCSCGQGETKKQETDVATAVDSAKEQHNLDSLFNAASKNVEGAKDSTKK